MTLEEILLESRQIEIETRAIRNFIERMDERETAHDEAESSPFDPAPKERVAQCRLKQLRASQQLVSALSAGMEMRVATMKQRIQDTNSYK